jgi:hypothetical protein
MSTSFISAAICIGVIGLNLLATAAVLRDESLSDAKRMIQLVAVWVFPVIGAVVVLFLHPGHRVTWPLSKEHALPASPPQSLSNPPPPSPRAEPGDSGSLPRP